MLLRKWLYPLFVLLSVLLLAGCTSQIITNTSSHAGQPSKEMGFQEVADYIKEHHELPPNYITKKKLVGWAGSLVKAIWVRSLQERALAVTYSEIAKGCFPIKRSDLV